MSDQVGELRLPFWAPEVIQSSAMDCGPASLKSFLEGHGISLSYGRLREACQTGVDGTSIDTLEELAIQLGLPAEQVIVPADHLLLPAAELLPALVVVQLPNGNTHFVIALRRIGPFVQVMDPGLGRQWRTVSRFEAELFRHKMMVPAADWRDYAATDDFLIPLRSQLAGIGLKEAEIEAQVTAALNDPSWYRLAKLDAAVRFVTALGQNEKGVLDLCLGEPAAGEAPALPIPARFWSVRPGEDGEESAAEPNPAEVDEILYQGAVLLKVDKAQPIRPAAATLAAGNLPPELQAALAERPITPLRDFLDLLRLDGLLPILLFGIALLLSVGGTLTELILLRGLIDVAEQGLPVTEARREIVTLFGLSLLLGGLLLWIEDWLLRVGRRSEVRLRERLIARLDRLPDRYFQSRLTSDMAERDHSLFRLRLARPLLGESLRTFMTLLLTTLGIIWLSPQNWGLALIALGFAIGIPLLINPVLVEKDLRLRSHLGALSRFYFDSLLGIVPIRVHAAEPAIRHAHRSMLRAWIETGFSFVRTAVTAEALQALSGFGIAIIIIWAHLSGSGRWDNGLLLLYWTLSLPLLGELLLAQIRQYPSMRSIYLRIEELLNAPADPAPDHPQAQAHEPGPVGIKIRRLAVEVAGHRLLSNIDLEIKPGEHVAIVGPSGAGKSSLLGVLLGWHRPQQGAVLIDHRPLNSQLLAELRAQIAWVDPTVRLWNRSMIDNLRYGRPGNGKELPNLIDAAELRELVERLPRKLDTALGEGGTQISGGEGQRVRLGRAIRSRRIRLALLDEPFRGLDRDLRQRLLARTRALWQEATLICVTHDFDQADRFDRVIVVENGTISEVGQPLKLLAQPDSRYSHYRSRYETAQGRISVERGWAAAHMRAGRLERGKS